MRCFFFVMLMGSYTPSYLYCIVPECTMLFPSVMGRECNSETKESQVVYMEIKSVSLDSVTYFS